MRSKLLILVLLFLFFGAKPVFASSVVINEIMYDLEGSDSHREWIELLNTGTDVDLTNWRFEESGTQHALILKQGNAVVSNERYAMIVDDYTQFLQDHPGFSGTVFDSSFSLSNTGENLKLRDAANGNIIDEVNYTSALGAAGDGNSLQRKSDGNWIAAFPTLGSQNANNPPIPIPSPTPSPTPTPTPKPTVKPSPTATPTHTPAPTANPSSTPKPSILPLTVNQAASSDQIANSDKPIEFDSPSFAWARRIANSAYRLASVAAATTSATPPTQVNIKDQKQTNPIVWAGFVFILIGTSLIGYIYLKKNAKIHL